MVIFPLIAFVVSAACAVVIGRDALRQPRPDRIVWTAAFAIFAVAAAAEVAGSLNEWSAPLARLYYLCGAVLVVGYLALGEGYLLARDRIAKLAPGMTLLVTALAATLVIDAPIDNARLAEDGWDAIEQSPALVVMTVTINALGTFFLVGGALYSAWRFRKLGIQRQRMIGCVLIAAGTLVVASGGTLTRFGQHEYLYIAMAIGVAIIFAGVLQTRRPDASSAQLMSDIQPQHIDRGAGKPRLVSLSQSKHAPGATGLDPGLVYIESKLLLLVEADLSRECAVWSVPRRDLGEFNRDQARLVWDLRTRLSLSGQDAFDLLSAAVRLQIAELYADVFSAPGASPKAVRRQIDPMTIKLPQWLTPNASDASAGKRELPDATAVARWAAWIAAGLLITFLVLPLVAIIHRTWSEAGDVGDRTWEILREALTLTLWTTAVTLVVIVLLGTPLAFLLARKHFPGKSLIETLIDLPMVLPPAVAGIALLMAFGRRGLIGESLDEWGITIGFTSIAVIMAQIFVASPFYVRSARAGFARSDRELEDAAADLGATPLRVLRTVTLPMAKSSLAAGSVLAWARAVGEFGATIIFAGSIAGRTQTMPLAIYGRYEAGDLSTALVLAVILLGASMLVLLAVRVSGGGRLR